MAGGLEAQVKLAGLIDEPALRVLDVAAKRLSSFPRSHHLAIVAKVPVWGTPISPMLSSKAQKACAVRFRAETPIGLPGASVSVE